MDKRLELSVTSLESVLQRLVGVHEEMVGLLHRKRDAMRRGQALAMTELCGLENEKVQAISELEKSRLEVVGQLTLILDAQAAEPMRMGEMLPRLPEPWCGRLGVLRQQLRDRMVEASQQASVVRRAAESLMRHVQGLVRSISVVSSGTSTYGDRGSPPPSATVTTFNMTA